MKPPQTLHTQKHTGENIGQGANKRSNSFTHVILSRHVSRGFFVSTTRWRCGLLNALKPTQPVKCPKDRQDNKTHTCVMTEDRARLKRQPLLCDCSLAEAAAAAASVLNLLSAWRSGGVTPKGCCIVEVYSSESCFQRVWMPQSGFL